MGGPGSGQHGGRQTVEGSYRLDVETLVRSMRGRGTRGSGQVVWPNKFVVNFGWDVSDPLYGWINLYFSAEDRDCHQLVYLYRTQPHLGGDRWWFVCPGEDQRLRMLYLPPGAKRFGSRRAYQLAYASQRESAKDRAIRRARKIKARLGGDGALLGDPPEKPLWMRWATYRRLAGQLAAAEQAAVRSLRILS
jgi:hypothetical protein